jgi:hypothetical protein
VLLRSCLGAFPGKSERSRRSGYFWLRLLCRFTEKRAPPHPFETAKALRPRGSLVRLWLRLSAERPREPHTKHTLNKTSLSSVPPLRVSCMGVKPSNYTYRDYYLFVHFLFWNILRSSFDLYFNFGSLFHTTIHSCQLSRMKSNPWTVPLCIYLTKWHLNHL